jgi:DNA-binding CsgD family transcriptional regulator
VREPEAADFSLGPGAEDLYLDLLRPVARTDPAARSGDLDQLLALGLVRSDPDASGGFTALDPRAAGTAWSEELYRRAELLLRNAAAVPSGLDRLARAFQQSGAASGDDSTGIQYLRGLDVIQSTVDRLCEQVGGERVTAQPHGPRNTEKLASTVDADVSYIKGGGRLRTLYQDSARWHGGTQEYVARVVQAGAQIRTVPWVFTRVFVFDRAIAIVPSNGLAEVLRGKAEGYRTPDSYQTALCVRNPALVAHLVDFFDIMWALARDWDGSPVSEGDGGTADLEPIERTILGYLDQDLTMEAIAGRLGVSERTLGKRLTKLKAKLGATSLYGLGRRWQAMQDGAGRPQDV